MKKNLLYLFTLLCSFSLFIACSDDDDDDGPVVPPVDESWKELSDTYKSATLDLKLEGWTLSSTDGAEKTAVVNATSAEAATVKLNNVIPENKEVSINATLTKANDLYSIAGETTVDACKVAISGNFSADGKLTLTATRTLSSAITGNLALLFTEAELNPVDEPGKMYPYVPVHWKAVTGNEEVDAQLAAIGPMLGKLIAEKVSAVNVKLGANGLFDVNWIKVGETDPTGIPAEIAPLVGNIYYTVKDGTLSVVLDKSLLSLAEMFAGLLEQYGINVADLLGLMTDMGGYYGLPMSYVQAENGVITFMMGKDQLLGILNVLGPILIPMLPEEMQGLGELLQLLPTAQELELGLPFIQQ